MRSQSGGALVLAVGLALALAAICGLVADAGVLNIEKARLQSAADAAALAAALVLPDGREAAAREAGTYLERNGLVPEDARVDFPAVDAVRVEACAMARALIPALAGAEWYAVRAASEARCERFPQGGVRPFAIPESSFVEGGTYALRAGPRGGQQGNFRAVAVDAAGAPAYEEAILLGASRSVSVGEELSTEPGIMEGPTEEAIASLIATTSAAVGRVVLADASCSADQVCDLARCRRVIVALLVDPLAFYAADGREPVRVTGFASFYLIGVDGAGEVLGRFLRRFDAGSVPGRRYLTISRLIH